MKNSNAKRAAELVGKAHSALSSLYSKGKEKTKKAIHDKKKSIAREVIDETKRKVDKSDRVILRNAESIVREAYKGGGKLIGNQYKLDVNKNGKIDAEDLAIIRGEKKMRTGGEVVRYKLKGTNFGQQIENGQKMKALITKVFESQSEDNKYPYNFINEIAFTGKIVKSDGSYYLKDYMYKGTLSKVAFLDDPNFIEALKYVDRPAIRKFEDGGGVDKESYESLYPKIVNAVMKDIKVSKEKAESIVDKNESYLIDMIEYDGETNPSYLADIITTTDEGKYATGGGVVREHYDELIGRKGEEFYVLQSIFKHSDDFKGATGVVVVPVTEAHYEYATSKEGIIERYIDGMRLEEWAEHFGIDIENSEDLQHEVEEAIWESSRYGGFEVFEEADYEIDEQIRKHVPEFADKNAFPIFEIVGAGRIFSKNMNFDKVYNSKLLAKINEVESSEMAERGKNVKGSKHVHLTKGWRNPHGYKAVKGSDKNRDYSKGHPHIKVDKGFAMPHGYEAVDGVYAKHYDTGGSVSLQVGDMVKIMPNYSSHYTNEKGEIVKIMPDNKTYEVKIRHKSGNEYVKFEKSELVFIGNEPRHKFDTGGGVGLHKHVTITKRGHRLPHGYKAVRGATKKADYSHKGVEMDLGWRLSHGYVLEKGADKKAYYKHGGNFEDFYNENVEKGFWNDNNWFRNEYSNNKFFVSLNDENEDIIFEKDMTIKQIIDYIKNKLKSGETLIFSNEYGISKSGDDFILDVSGSPYGKGTSKINSLDISSYVIKGIRNDISDYGKVLPEYMTGEVFNSEFTKEEKMFVKALIEKYMDNLSNEGKEVAKSVLHKLK